MFLADLICVASIVSNGDQPAIVQECRSTEIFRLQAVFQAVVCIPVVFELIVHYCILSRRTPRTGLSARPPRTLPILCHLPNFGQSALLTVP